jgi:hypothetical protein
MPRVREFIVPIKWKPLDGRLWIDAEEVKDWRTLREKVQDSLGQLLMLQGPSAIDSIAQRLLDSYPNLNAIELTKEGYGEVHYQDWP